MKEKTVVKNDVTNLHKFEIRVCCRNSKRSNITKKFKNFCNDVLSKKNGKMIQVTSDSIMIETDKRTVLGILNELDQNSIPIRTEKLPE